LTAGKDFIVDPGMKKTAGQYDIVRIEKNMVLYTKAEISGKWILLDTVGTGIQIKKDDWTAWKQNVFGAAGMIIIQPVKLTWSVSTEEEKFPVIEIVKSALPTSATSIKLNICNKFIPRHETQNVIGYIPGKSNPDSYLFISAHYDHLGRMGTNAWFPGANDNASGIAMLLNLAKYYSQHPPEYSIAFIAFAGEEAGLIGSMYYTENPLVPLNSIKFLLNLDLLGTGDEGMMVVNATEYPQHFTRLDSINTSQQLLPKIGQRGKAANSDHYFFTEKGVPAFFCYTLGGISAYHDIYDIEKTLPLTRFKEVFQLFTGFLDTTK
jgi:Iap family predicted aminopeptidase